MNIFETFSFENPNKEIYEDNKKTEKKEYTREELLKLPKKERIRIEQEEIENKTKKLYPNLNFEMFEGTKEHKLQEKLLNFQ